MCSSGHSGSRSWRSARPACSRSARRTGLGRPTTLSWWTSPPSVCVTSCPALRGRCTESCVWCARTSSRAGGSAASRRAVAVRGCSALSGCCPGCSASGRTTDCAAATSAASTTPPDRRGLEARRAACLPPRTSARPSSVDAKAPETVKRRGTSNSAASAAPRLTPGDRGRRSAQARTCRLAEEGGANLHPGASLRVVAAINGHRPGREVTRALVERAASGEPGARLRSQIAAGRPGATAEQVEEAVQQACLNAARSCRGQSEPEVVAWLRTTARRELARSEQRARRELPVDPHVLSLLPGAGFAAAPEQQLIDHEDDLEVERVARAVLARLSERQRELIALHVRGRKRAQIAAHLGITPRSVKRQLARIMAEARAELVRLAGEGCPARQPLVARLAFGLANPREVREAQLHLATCPRCGVLYERLDLWRAKVAALLPLPAVERARPGLSDWALQRVGDGLASLKQHATAGYARVVDPTPLAGVRPGAAAAAITGCLALGSGTTYCVTQSVDPIGRLAQIVTPTRKTQPAPRRQKRVDATRASSTSTPSPARTVVATPTAEPS